MEAELDFDCGVIEVFGGSRSAHLIHFIASFEREEGDLLAVFEVETRLQGTEGDFAAAVGSDGEEGRPAEIEIFAIPKFGFEDTSAADQRAPGRRGFGRGHDAAPSNLGRRARL